MNRDLNVFHGRQDNDLEKVGGTAGPNDQPTVGVFAGIFDGKRMVNRVEDVFVGDCVLARRVVYLHSD